MTTTTTTTKGAIRITGIDVHAYLTKDAPRAIAFYRDVLGLTPETIYPDDKGAEFELPDRSTFGLWDPGDDFPFTTNNGIMFAVEDFDAAIAAVGERGGTIFMTHDGPTCRMAMLNDPDGNGIILHKRKT